MFHFLRIRRSTSRISCSTSWNRYSTSSGFRVPLPPESAFHFVRITQQVEDHAAQLLERHLNTGASASRWRFRFETATARAGICRYTSRTVALSVSYVLRAPWRDIRDTLLHEIAHAIVGTRPRTRRCVADSRAAHRLHGEALQHRHPQPEAVDRKVPPVSRPVVPSTPDGESSPTRDLPTVPLAHRLENQRSRGRPLTVATHEPACRTARSF